VKHLGWTEVPAVIMSKLDDALVALKAERNENVCRDRLTPSELARRGSQLEELLKPEAASREKSGTNQHTKPCGKLPQGSTGKTRDKVAAALGVSGRTYEKAKQVAKAAVVLSRSR
jgi:uncharacterized protein GlcG (DUF336 family)